MTRKDFELVARTIKNLMRLDATSREYVATKFADAMANANANFDRAKFLKACGVTP